jgi:hypothetical protein
VRERARARSAPSSRPPKATSFRSSFVPEPRAAYYPGQDDGYVKDDLRGIDPFYLFSRVFGDAFQMPSQGQPAAPSRQQQPSPFDTMGDLASHPIFATAGAGRTKPLKMKESHTSAHINRHGQVNISRSEKSIKVTKGGSMSFESHSFSGSFGNGNMDMLQQFLGGPGMFGQQSGGQLASPFSALPGIAGPQPGSRSRRQSFDAAPSPLSMGSGLQRRPSFSRSNSFDEPPNGPPSPWSASAGSQMSLFGSDQSLAKQNWGNGW